MKEFIKRLGNTIWSALKTLLFIALIFIAGSIIIGLLVHIPVYLLDTYTSINGVWWSVGVLILLIVMVLWDSISEKIKWLIEPLKNKKEEDVD